MTIEPYSIRYAIGTAVLPPKPAPKQLRPAMTLEQDAAAIRRRMKGQRLENPEVEAARRGRSADTAQKLLRAFIAGAETLPQIMMTHAIPDASARLALRHLIMAGDVLAVGRTKSGAVRYAVRGADE